MNNRMNDSKGMTIVEVLVSVVIISLIMGVLFTLLLQVQKINSDTSKRSSILLAQNVVTKAIERDMIEIGVKAISNCTFDQFGFNGSVIDSTENDGELIYNYECIRIEYNQSYDMSDVGYLMVYKQSSSQDDPAWVLRYGRGYYNECEKNSVPIYSNWKETYSVVQKLDSDVDLKIMPNNNEVSYSAKYESGKKYSEQKMNSGKLFVPLQDENGYNYNIDLSFSFRLYSTNNETVSDTNVNFICDDSNPTSLDCKCSSSISDCAKTKIPDNSKDESGRYIYRCSEAKASLGSVVGANKNFIELSNVVENGIYASKVESIVFMSTEDYANEYESGENGKPVIKRSSIDISYSQNGTNLMYFEKNSDTGKYKLFITQSGGVKFYGSTFANMFKNFTNLVSVDFAGLVSAGVTSMNSMFYNCPELKELINFNTLDFSSVTDVSSMFYKCTKLTSSPFGKKGEIPAIDLSSVLYANSTFNESGISGVFIYKDEFNAQNIVSLRNFLRKSKITEFKLDYDGQEMPRLNSINSMFADTTTLTKAEFKNTIAKELVDAEMVFKRASGLTDSVFDNFIVEKLGSLYGFFDQCKKLVRFSFINFDTSNVKSFSEFFKECELLVNVDLTGFSFDNATSFCRIFYYCLSLQTVKFGEEDSDVSLDHVTNLQQAFQNDSAFKGIVGKHVTFHGVTTVAQMFEGAGNGNVLDMSNMELYICYEFSYMFRNAKFGAVNLSGIHSQYTGGSLNLTGMFISSTVHYLFLNDAEFKTKVIMTDMFSSCNTLTFVKGVNYKDDTSLINYLTGSGIYESLVLTEDGRSPFDRFIVENGYASSLANLFNGCKYLRGFPDGYLDGIKTNNKTTNYSKMFYGAFDVDILSNVTFESEAKYKSLYQLVLPFKFTGSSVDTLGETFVNTGNLAVIKFKDAADLVAYAPPISVGVNETIFYNLGQKAYAKKRISSIDVYLNSSYYCIRDGSTINPC